MVTVGQSAEENKVDNNLFQNNLRSPSFGDPGLFFDEKITELTESRSAMKYPVENFLQEKTRKRKEDGFHYFKITSSNSGGLNFLAYVIILFDHC